MIRVKTKAGDILMYEIPKEAYDIEIIDSDTIFYWLPEKDEKGYDKTGQVDIDKICYEWYKKLSELNKELEELVDVVSSNYIDYNTKPITLTDIEGGMWSNTPKQSFISLIKSQHPEFQEDKEYLLIKLL